MPTGAISPIFDCNTAHAIAHFHLGFHHSEFPLFLRYTKREGGEDTQQGRDLTEGYGAMSSVANT